MRYREQTAEGDYQFLGTSPFLANSPQTVAQAIRTRLRLRAGDWFLDNRLVFDLAKVLGTNTQATRDDEVKRVITGTPGVRTLLSYGSEVSADRRFTVTATIDTIYGQVTITEAL